MTQGVSRRTILAAGALALGANLTHRAAAQQQVRATGTFRYCLNTSTISGQKLTLPQQIETAAKAGYNAIEPWIRDIETYAKSGASLADLKKRSADLGLSVENAIGFARWIVDDDADREKGLEQAKREMDMLAQLGCKRIAAPPSGANNQPDMNLFKAAERYHKLVEIGQQFNVTPQVEIWGGSKCLGRLGEAILVAFESGHPKACVLPDVYHMYKGGSPFGGLKLLSAAALQMIHMNDYPADPPRATIGDQHRVYPGDGIAPLTDILRDLRAINPNCVLSLELFNRDYWKLDALDCAKRGLDKMKAAVAKIA